MLTWRMDTKERIKGHPNICYDENCTYLTADVKPSRNSMERMRTGNG